MIKLYFWPTPNGKKISIMLEECGLEYEAKPVDIGAGDQFSPEFLRISPNNRMPAIVDTDTGISVFEGGAILIYLAEKAEMFLPQEQAPRFDVLQWLFWQAGGWARWRASSAISRATPTTSTITPSSVIPTSTIGYWP